MLADRLPSKSLKYVFDDNTYQEFKKELMI